MTLVIASLDASNGMRALKVTLYGSNSYYLAETRRTPSGLRLVVYYIKGAIESGKGSIVVETVLSPNGLFFGERITRTFIVLESQADGLKVRVAGEAEGKKAEQALQALESASDSVEDAWSSSRVVGFSQAKEECNGAWQFFHDGDFDAAILSADRARELADAAKVPESYFRFVQLRPNVGARLQNASAFQSAEAIRYVEIGGILLTNADGNFTAKDFDSALSNLLEADHNIAMAEDAERAAIRTQTATQVSTGGLPEIPLQVIAIALLVGGMLVLVMYTRLRKKRTSVFASVMVRTGSM